MGRITLHLLGSLIVAGAFGRTGIAKAEKADRTKPMTIEADRPSSVDLAKQVIVFNGNVVITQGTIRIAAERVEIREAPDGARSATAIGSNGKPATFRQKRDGLDEYVEGTAERVEYDGRGDVVRFVGNASVKRLRGTTTADEVTGNLITYDNDAELFSVQGGSQANNGRVRAVLTPRDSGAAASGVKP